MRVSARIMCTATLATHICTLLTITVCLLRHGNDAPTHNIDVISCGTLHEMKAGAVKLTQPHTHTSCKQRHTCTPYGHTHTHTPFFLHIQSTITAVSGDSKLQEPLSRRRTNSGKSAAEAAVAGGEAPRPCLYGRCPVCSLLQRQCPVWQ